ncbi:helix-turn-helix domain-containing protein [Bradyrhizobium sp. C-145]|uniref:helix-turn-helix domain-containing protein n=1 Tax=Bradyrhizobium sp. C-145 TaxID=574727 RepID=UPI00201B8553|nr:helix-turn-helix domain-containing protein [Bradyrhizobium sp. C-145]UQR65101.1 helix-turn-helix domain-containing protein [Bradyrhizobium sp. C-145]
MTRPFSEDIRERALARADAGETVRSIAEALQIGPSCVTKWKNLRRETGGVSPGKIGGHKKPVLSGTNADWLRKRIHSGPFTLRKLPPARLDQETISSTHKSVSRVRLRK